VPFGIVVLPASIPLPYPGNDRLYAGVIGAFMRIDNAAVRRRIVMLMQEIAGDDDN
jgi:hypothetical protein